jgi:hypothetical protein
LPVSTIISTIVKSHDATLTGDGAGGGFFGLGTVLDLNLLQQNSCSMGQPASPFDAMNGGGGGLFFKEAKVSELSSSFLTVQRSVKSR